MKIRAGSKDEVEELSNWIILDIGFAKKKKSNGLLICKEGENTISEETFADVKEKIKKEILKFEGAVGLIIEAPLSVAFDVHGNPSGRKFEKSGTKVRYWYLGLGCAVMTAATFLMRELHELKVNKVNTELVLFEGFVSFKGKGEKSDHIQDVEDLWKVISCKEKRETQIVDEGELVGGDCEIFSAFKVAGMDLGIPPIIIPIRA